MKKFQELEEKNGPFSAAFVMGGVPTVENDLTALFDLIKSEYTSKKSLLCFLLMLKFLIGKFPIYFVANKVKNGLLEDTLIEELAQRNVHFMRPFGVTKTPEGLRFAYISGIESHKESKNQDEIIINSEDLQYIEEQYMLSSERDEDEGLIDVLFTWSWPQEMKNSLYRHVPESHRLGPLIWNLKPRYIFTPTHDSVAHFERAPYENVDMKSGEFLHPTRFIALTSAEGVSSNTAVKKKWIYAMNLVPAKFVTPLTLAKRPDDCTTNPFLPVASKPKESSSSSASAPNYFFQVADDSAGKRKLETDPVAPAQLKRPPPGYVCKKCHSDAHYYRDCIYKDSTLQPDANSTYVCHICHEPGHHIRNCPKKHEQAMEQRSNHKSAPKTVAPESCWFCLSNPASRKHLVVDIGEEVYLALAKGPLTRDHLIIVPIEHISSTATEIAASLSSEVENYMKKVDSLHSDKKPIFFKMSANPTHHFHIQAVFIDAGKLENFLEFLEDFSIKLGYKFVPRDNSSELAYFEFSYVSASGEIVRLAHEFDPAAFFPAQYGRQVLASFLEIEGGSDWKNQLYTEDDEKSFVSDLKKIFK